MSRMFSAVVLLALLGGCRDKSIIATSDGGGEDSGGPGSSSDSAMPGDSGPPDDTGDSGPTDVGPIIPLYDESSELDPPLVSNRGDAIVTRFADRGRDRHAREDQFQSYEHFLPHYWKHRTARFRFVDTVAAGGGTLEISFVTEWKLSVAEFRAWYSGRGTVAAYSGNYAAGFTSAGPGTFDEDHAQVSEEGNQYRYSFILDHAIDLNGAVGSLEVGQYMEFEASQFLDGPPEGRANYYGTTMLYAVGTGGLVPWEAVGDFEDASSERENSHPIAPLGWLGGRTTLHRNYSNEPDNAFMQMATHTSSANGQPFVRGRRVHHTNVVDGSHDESADNGTFSELTGLGGPYYTHTSCDGCHHRNGRAPVAEVGEPFDAWVVLVGDEEGAPLPQVGRVVQSSHVSGDGEGTLAIAEWVENADGLRRPVYSWGMAPPARFSARIAPALVGMGLLEAISESDVLALEDASDANGDGISGRAHRVPDPVTGETRLGRFGWKASTISVRHQAAAALRDDMGVMTSLFTEPDCGSAQTDCGNDAGVELSDAHLDDLTRYVALLGVHARRDLDDPTALQGEQLFDELGCASCHTPSFVTSEHHPRSELRSQTIHPYTDLLLHDMGPELADSLGDGQADGAEWRTPPLWGIGLGPCVTGGVEGEDCTPDASYLHDGRARTLDEAIRWHGGEGEGSRDAYLAASDSEQAAMIRFLETL